MKVLKFGGTSVGTIESLRNVKAIVDAIEEPCIVVVSALGGLTDMLINTAEMAANGDERFRDNIRVISTRHHDIINALVPPEQRSDIRREVGELLSRLEDIYVGLSLIGDLPEKVLERVVSFGEQMSSIIVASILKDARHANSLDFIKTEKWFGKCIAARELTHRLIVETFERPLQQTIVIGGFISRDHRSGEVTNLGRGGSDYTAALIAAALGADVLEIWTDVDGFMTADPRIIPDARVIDRMSFVESMELCTFGAKVVYPPTIYPVFHKSIPIKILNTHNPTAPGTMICEFNGDMPSEIRGVSAIKDASMFCIDSKPELAGEVKNRAVNALSRNGVTVTLIDTVEGSGRFAFAVPGSDADRAEEVLRNEFAPEISSGATKDIERADRLSEIAVVRESIGELVGLGKRLTESLGSAGIEVKGKSEGSSDTTIVIVVEAREVDNALRRIHAECFAEKASD